MHTSGSIGGTSRTALAARGVPMDLAALPAQPPAEWAAAWKVAAWRPAPRIVHGAAGAVALLSESPAAIFDRFSPARSAPAATFHVAPGGSDGGAGTQASPWRTIGKAIAAANTGGQPARIMVAAGEYPRYANPAYAGVTPAVDIAFLAYGGRVVTGSWDELGTPPADGAYPNTYALANAGADRVIDRTRLDQQGFHPDYPRVASAGTCNRIPGSWAYDGGKVHIHRHDGAPVTSANTRMLRSNAAVWSFANPVSVFLGSADAGSGFDTIGGSANAGFIYQPATLPPSMRAVIVERSSFCYNGGATTVPDGANGTRIANLHGLALFVDCDASNNTRDGFSAGNFGQFGALNHLVTVNCRAIRCGARTEGYNTAQSCNSYTLHEDCVGADFAGRFAMTGGGLVRNVGSSVAWFAGTRMADDRGDMVVGGSTVASIVQANDTARIWLDRVQMEAAPAQALAYASSGAAVRLRGMPPLRSAAQGSGRVESW